MIKSCEGFEDLCAFTAAGAATPEEEKMLVAHIASCGDCRHRLQELKEVGLHFLTALPPVLPPPSIRANLFNALEQEKRITPRLSPAPPAKRKSFFVRFPWTTAIPWAIAGIFGMILLENINTEQQANSHQNLEIASLRRTLSEKEEALISLHLSLSEKEDALSLISARQTRAVLLTGDTSSSNALSKIFWNPERNTGFFFAFDLPLLPNGKVYQLWAIQQGTPVDAGVFSFSVETGSFKVKPIPNPSEAIQLFAITTEPTGGSSQPTGEILLKGEVMSQL